MTFYVETKTTSRHHEVKHAIPRSIGDWRLFRPIPVNRTCDAVGEERALRELIYDNINFQVSPGFPLKSQDENSGLFRTEIVKKISTYFCTILVFDLRI